MVPLPLEVSLGNQTVIPVTVQLTTNTGQFTVGMLVALLGAFGLILIMYLPLIIQRLQVVFIAYHLKCLYKGTCRRAILINHNTSGFLNVQMITMDTAYKVADALTKFKGADFDLILNTPGGEVYATQFLSRLIRNYPGKIRAVIPMMAASGGTLLALSCDKLVMAPTAVLGPVDPQLGPFWGGGSARSWQEVLKKKGVKADDSSIQYAYLGGKVTKTIYRFVEEMLLKKHMRSVAKACWLAKTMTDGSLEHIFQFDATFLKRAGVSVELMPPEMVTMFHKMLKKKHGVEVVAA